MFFFGKSRQFCNITEACAHEEINHHKPSRSHEFIIYKEIVM